MVPSSKPGLRRILVGPDATVVVVLAAIVEVSELEVVSESEVVSLSLVVGWDKTVVDVSASCTDVLIETSVESVDSAMLDVKIDEGLHGDADANRYSISSWRAEFVNLMVIVVEGTMRERVLGE
jgi:hypothetical protein